MRRWPGYSAAIRKPGRSTPRPSPDPVVRAVEHPPLGQARPPRLPVAAVRDVALGRRVSGVAPEPSLRVEPVVAVGNVLAGVPVENGELLRPHNLVVDDDEPLGERLGADTQCQGHCSKADDERDRLHGRSSSPPNLDPRFRRSKARAAREIGQNCGLRPRRRPRLGSIARGVDGVMPGAGASSARERARMASGAGALEAGCAGPADPGWSARAAPRRGAR